MPGQTIGGYAGQVSGYRAVGDEVRADAGTPRLTGNAVSPSVSMPFRSPDVLGNGPQDKQGKPQEQPEQPQDESSGDTLSEAYGAHVDAPGAAYGGAAYNGGGGPLADAITNGDRGPAVEAAPARTAIGSGAGKVIAGIAEDVT